MAKEKDIIPKNYRNKSGEVTMNALVDYLEKHQITPEEAWMYLLNWRP